MFELLTVVVFCWLLVKSVGLALKLTWGAAKILVSILIALALPALIVCLLFVGGLVLLLPLAMLAVVVGIVKFFL